MTASELYDLLEVPLNTSRTLKSGYSDGAGRRADGSGKYSLDTRTHATVADILVNHRAPAGYTKNRWAAEPSMIALARVHGLAVVTMEGPPEIRTSLINPDVCNAYRLPLTRPLETFRAEGAWFGTDPPH